MYEPVFYVCWGWPCMVPMHYFKFVKCLCKFLWRKKTSLCHVLPRQRPRAATSTPTERLLAQHVSTYEPNTCQPTSPTRFNQRAQHVSIYQPYTCQPCDHTRVRCKPAETVQWRGKNRHGCNDIYDKIHKIVKVQQLWRYKDDEDDFVIASSQIYVHDVFGLYYDKSGLSWMWTFLVVSPVTSSRSPAFAWR